MNVTAIKRETDHRAALKKISRLMESDPAPDTLEGDELDVLVTLVQAYEAKHYPVDPPTPIEAIKFRMEQQGMTVVDLIPMIGTRSRVYEVLNGKRPLTMAMIRRLHAQLGIPAEVLIQQQPQFAVM